MFRKLPRIKFTFQKSRIRETKNLSIDADSSTNTKKILLLRQNSPRRRFYTLYEQKFSNLRRLLSITFPQGFRISKNFGHPTSGSGGKKTFNSSTDTTVGWTKNTQKPNFFEKRKNHPKRKNSKTPRDMPKLAIYPSTRGL